MPCRGKEAERGSTLLLDRISLSLVKMQSLAPAPRRHEVEVENVCAKCGKVLKRHEKAFLCRNYPNEINTRMFHMFIQICVKIYVKYGYIRTNWNATGSRFLDNINIPHCCVSKETSGWWVRSPLVIEALPFSEDTMGDMLYDIFAR